MAKQLYLNPPTLMMDVMIYCVLTSQHLERVPGDTVTAMVVHRFKGRQCSEEDSLAGGELRQPDRKVRAYAVDDELLVKVAIKGAKGIGNVDLFFRSALGIYGQSESMEQVPRKARQCLIGTRD